ncbi:MAG TPA: hypothetical protein VF122_05675 [Caulobacteraceae bacterium]
MNPTINRLKLIFLAVFFIGAVAAWVYQVWWAIPQKQCEADGKWWDAGTRICAQPIYIPDITGRPEGMSRKEWSEQKAAEVMEKGL